MKNFLAGVAIASVFLFPVALWVMYEALDAAVQEADIRSAARLMQMLKPGITDCLHEGRTMNCRSIQNGKRKDLVLATGSQDQ